MRLATPLRGIVPPLITPLADPHTLDTDGLDRLIAHILAGGVHGLFILGTSGEGPNIGRRLRSELISQACAVVAGRVPVLVGITDASFEDAVALANQAAEAGAAALVYAGPLYSRPSQKQLLAHVRRLADALPLPVFLYNMPSHTGFAFDVETVVRAAEHPNVAGLKDSSGNVHYYARCCRALESRADFAFMMGPEELLVPSLLAGGDGGVSGGSNLFPALYVALHAAAERGEWAEARRLQSVVLEVSEGLYNAGYGGSSYLRGMKCALELSGLCAGALAEPYQPLDASDRAHISAGLDRLRPLVARTLNPGAR